MASAIRALSVIVPLLAVPVLAGSLKDVEHVILFMQENRAFDHYFGAMAGVRGFSDPNVQVNSGKPVWFQEVNSALTNATDFLAPWHINYQGGDWYNATQCMTAGSNGWKANHLALNNDLNNQWPVANTPWSVGYYKREDIPVQYAIADGWTIGDMYQESIISSTNPNRAFWASGSINVPGNPQTPDQGGTTLDNNETPGCEGKGLNCYPLAWKTTAEFYQDAGVSWQVYQDEDNYDDNPFAWFKQYQDAAEGSPLADKGLAIKGLQAFYDQAANGTLPAVSFIIGPKQLSEHPPFSPRDGAWLQKKIVDAVTQGAGYKNSVLIISYDETGGLGDHVTPYHSPNGTVGEWMEDPYAGLGQTYSGPGFRLPFYIISPWTRGGAVFTEHSDHASQIMFVEEWLAAKGKNVKTDQMVAWRRKHMSNLMNAFDFEHPDYSLPKLPEAPAPHVNAKGIYDGSSYCQSLYKVVRPDPPYGQQSKDVKDIAKLSESGFKSVRGALTEGRYLTFENDDYSLCVPGKGVKHASFGKEGDKKKEADENQKWVIHQLEAGGNKFYLSSGADGKYLTKKLDMTPLVRNAETFSIIYTGAGEYTIQASNGQYINIGSSGNMSLSKKKVSLKTYSVT